MEILVVPVILGLITGVIAQNKGRCFVSWWIYGMLLFIVALPHALLMKRSQAVLDQRAREEGKKKCPACAELVRDDAKICRFCRHEFTIPLVAVALALILSACATTSTDRSQVVRFPSPGQIIAYPLGIAIYPLVLLWRANDPPYDPANPIGPSTAERPEHPGAVVPGSLFSSPGPAPSRGPEFIGIFDRHGDRTGWGRHNRDGSR